MKRYSSSRRSVIIPVAAVIIILAAFLLFARPEEPEPVPPPSLEVEVFNGSDYIRIIPQEGVPVNSLSASDFTADLDGEPVYTGTEYDTLKGIDISLFQRNIDWNAVRDSGIDFVLIRAAGRGYSQEGPIYEDAQFEENYAGARSAGLKVGVYFFSQATNIVEAAEEADFVIDMLHGKDIDLPVYFDWENITYDEARTDGLSGVILTDCAVTFCERVLSAGYDAGVYIYQQTGYYSYELRRLAPYSLWCASIGNYPYFYYAHDIWQYSIDGSVPGIDTVCDMNMMFVEK